MYNSLLVNLIAKLLDSISTGYETSLLKLIVDGIKKFFATISKNSIFLNLLIRKMYFEDTVIYKVFSLIIDFLNKLFSSINKYIRKIGKNSILYSSTYKLFENEVESLRTLFIFTFFFSVSLIINNIIRGYFSGKSYFVGVILVLISLVGLGLKDNYKNLLESSLVVRWIEDLFTVDEGGGNWW